MKILIAIPSKARAYDLQKGILKWLPECNHDWKVFVEPQDLVHYVTVLDKSKIVCISKNDKGMGFVINSIARYAIKFKYDLVFKIDDDFSGMVCKDIGNMKTGHSVKILDKFLNDVAPDFQKDQKLGAVRISNSRNHLFEKMGKDRKYTHRNVPLYHGWIVRPEILEKVTENVLTQDDSSTFLYMQEAGYYSLNYGQAAVNYKDNTNPGGFQCFDRERLVLETYEYLKKEFPKIRLKPIDRTYKIEIDISEYCRQEPL